MKRDEHTNKRWSEEEEEEEEKGEKKRWRIFQAP
jgi:hypothetical protein